MSFRKIDNFLNIFCTGDLHLSHLMNRSIQKRGFNNPEQHTTFVRNQINSVVKSKSDILIINGDCGSPEILLWFLDSLTSCNIWLTVGNHDHIKELLGLRKLKKVMRVEDNIKINYRDNLFYISHLPHKEWDGLYRNSYHPFAHTHNTMKPYLRAIDCGLDAQDMKPIHLDDVVKLRENFTNIDEYGKRIDI